MIIKKQGYDYVKNLLRERKLNFLVKVKERNSVYSKIKNGQIRRTILLLREAAYAKDYFCGSVSEIIYYFLNPLFKEMARRIKIKKEDIKYLTSHELKEAIFKRKINHAVIKKRQRYYAMETERYKFFIFYSRQARLIEKKYFPTAQKIEVEKLIGIPTQKAKGRIKIILTYSDFKKFKKNDILVATNTMPEYMPILRKAKAVITDIGGITSYAAIVSRELGIPCIVGTKIATRVLKDGDLMEVDAERGIVRKIK